MRGLTGPSLVKWFHVKRLSLAIYAVLGAADLAFTLAALRLGILEGNPVLAWCQQQGLLIPAKVGLVAFAVVVAAYLWHRSPIVPRLMGIANALYGLIVLYHLWFWLPRWLG